MANFSNPVLRIGEIELSVSKNILIKNGVTHELEGIVVYTSVTDKVYVPSDAWLRLLCSPYFGKILFGIILTDADVLYLCIYHIRNITF